MEMMVPMEWDSKYSVEVAELDSQHKELMSFFNEALNNCSGEKSERKKYFGKTIEDFTECAVKHFRTEEQFLSSKNYVQYEEHKLEHIKLLEKIGLVKEEVQNDKWEINLFMVATTVRDWFLSHLNAYDINAKKFFKEGYTQTGDGKIFAFQS